MKNGEDSSSCPGVATLGGLVPPGAASRAQLRLTSQTLVQGLQADGFACLDLLLPDEVRQSLDECRGDYGPQEVTCRVCLRRLRRTASSCGAFRSSK